MLMGHLAADTEMRQTKTGKSVANFPIAINRTVKSDGEKVEVTDFHRVVAWEGLAKICEKYLIKGTGVYIDGRIMNHSFDDSDGKKHYRTEVVADNINIIKWKKAKNGDGEVQLEEVE